jgi:hypothetical protein
VVCVVNLEPATTVAGANTRFCVTAEQGAAQKSSPLLIPGDSPLPFPLKIAYPFIEPSPGRKPVTKEESLQQEQKETLLICRLAFTSAIIFVICVALSYLLFLNETVILRFVFSVLTLVCLIIAVMYYRRYQDLQDQLEKLRFKTLR